MTKNHLISTLTAALVLSGCAITMPPTEVVPAVAPQWQAPLPHQGTVTGLSQWWAQQGDPVLVELIEAAQSASPSVAQALARLESVKASRVSAGAVLLPKLDASVGTSRGVSQPLVPVATTGQVGLQASWELDLVGANRAVNKAATAQVDASQAQWHNARVLVAAEMANLYYGWNSCQQLLKIAQSDAASRQETARLMAISVKAGFAAPATTSLANASAAEARSRVTAQASQCDLNIKSMVELSAISEPDLRSKMAIAPVDNAQTAPISIAKVPAQALTQRPDVFAAERDVVLASAQVGSAQAQRYPRLTLGGSVGAARSSSMGIETNWDTWSFGPLALTLPLFDGGQRAANVEAARANYTQVVNAYQGKVRQAVREVEEALVNLQSTDARRADAEVSTQGYADSLAATQSRYGQGLASLVELEDARRNALAAQSAHITLQLERKRAWVSLYRALGGGWEPTP